MTPILHCTTRAAWDAAVAQGSYAADSLAQEGFIHLSTPAQILAVADARFRGQGGLVLLCVDAERLIPELRYENLEGGTLLFPHVYGPINLDAVRQVVAFPPEADGSFRMPSGLGKWGIPNPRMRKVNERKQVRIAPSCATSPLRRAIIQPEGTKNCPNSTEDMLAVGTGTGCGQIPSGRTLGNGGRRPRTQRRTRPTQCTPAQRMLRPGPSTRFRAPRSQRAVSARAKHSPTTGQCSPLHFPMRQKKRPSDDCTPPAYNMVFSCGSSGHLFRGADLGGMPPGGGLCMQRLRVQSGPRSGHRARNWPQARTETGQRGAICAAGAGRR